MIESRVGRTETVRKVQTVSGWDLFLFFCLFFSFITFYSTGDYKYDFLPAVGKKYPVKGNFVDHPGKLINLFIFTF